MKVKRASVLMFVHNANLLKNIFKTYSYKSALFFEQII